MVGLGGGTTGLLLPDDDLRRLSPGGSGHQPGLHRLRVVVQGWLEPRAKERLAADRPRHGGVRHALGQHHALDDVAGRSRLLRDALERFPLGIGASPRSRSIYKGAGPGTSWAVVRANRG